MQSSKKPFGQIDKALSRKVSVFYILALLASVFILLTSFFYKGWAFVIVCPGYYGGLLVPPLHGKVAVVTGFSDSSVIRQLVYDLVLSGAHCVVTARFKEDGEEMLANIKQKRLKDVNIGKLDVAIVDMGSPKSIERFATKFRRNFFFDSLDYLILNGDIFTWQFKETVNGIESIFAHNYLGQFLLTKLLLGKVKSSKTRILVMINYAYRLSYQSGIAFETLRSNRTFSAVHAYGQSKVAMAHFSYELSRRLKGSGATSNTVYPGLVTDSFISEKSWVYGQNLFASMSSVSGAVTLLAVAVSEKFLTVNGKHIEPPGIVFPNPPSLQINTTLAARLWRKSLSLSGQFF